MFIGSFAIDDVATFYVNSHTPSTGAAVDADADPGYRVYEDETGTPLLTGTMAKLDDANTAGFYSEQITLSAANGFELGKSYCIRITVVVGGVTGTALRFLQMGSKVDLRMIGGSVQSQADLKDFADDGYDPTTNKVQGVVLTDTLTTYTGNTVQTGDSFARLGAPAGASVSADIAAIKAVVDAILVDTGTTLDAKIDAIGVVVALFVSPQAEPTGVPAANDTPLTKLARIHQALRNMVQVDANTGEKLFFDDAGVALWKKLFTDAGGVYEEQEGVAP